MTVVNSWEVSDPFWAIAEPLLPKPTRDPNKEYKRAPGAGRKRSDARMMFEGMLYVMRTGIQWRALPREKFGNWSTVYKYFRLWEEAGFFKALWERGLSEYDELKGIGWEWQSVDATINKAPMALEAVGPNPTDRGKNGTKRHVITDERGVPLSITVTGANSHDVTQIGEVISSRIAKPIMENEVENLCADAGYTGEKAREIMEKNGYIPHVCSRGEEKNKKKQSEI